LYARKRPWAQGALFGAQPGAIPIEVTAQQFAWNFATPARTENLADEA